MKSHLSVWVVDCCKLWKHILWRNKDLRIFIKHTLSLPYTRFRPVAEDTESILAPPHTWPQTADLNISFTALGSTHVIKGNHHKGNKILCGLRNKLSYHPRHQTCLLWSSQWRRFGTWGCYRYSGQTLASPLVAPVSSLHQSVRHNTCRVIGHKSSCYSSI